MDTHMDGYMLAGRGRRVSTYCVPVEHQRRVCQRRCCNQRAGYRRRTHWLEQGTILFVCMCAYILTLRCVNTYSYSRTHLFDVARDQHE